MRYLQEKQQTIDPFKLPDDSPGQTTSGHGSLQSARLDWDEEDTKLIDEALSKYEKCPRNPEITKMFSSTPQPQQILEDNSFDRITNKVKTSFKEKTEEKEVSLKALYMDVALAFMTDGCYEGCWVDIYIS